MLICNKKLLQMSIECYRGDVFLKAIPEVCIALILLTKSLQDFFLIGFWNNANLVRQDNHHRCTPLM